MQVKTKNNQTTFNVPAVEEGKGARKYMQINGHFSVLCKTQDGKK